VEEQRATRGRRRGRGSGSPYKGRRIRRWFGLPARQHAHAEVSPSRVSLHQPPWHRARAAENCPLTPRAAMLLGNEGFGRFQGARRRGAFWLLEGRLARRPRSQTWRVAAQECSRAAGPPSQTHPQSPAKPAQWTTDSPPLSPVQGQPLFMPPSGDSLESWMPRRAWKASAPPPQTQT
jgi:hypothetical protein